MRTGKPTGATTALPAPGASFTTANNRPSRFVPSWYFGDGAVLFNQWEAAVAAALPILPLSARITPLDPMLTGAAATSSNAGTFGVRVGRRLTSRLTAEVNVDYAPFALELSGTAPGDAEASRATFARVWSEQLATGPWVNVAVSSQSEIEKGTGGETGVTGALTVRLRRAGPLVPYATGGLGGSFTHGKAPSVALKGSYSMDRISQGLQAPAGTVLSYNETDTVSVRFTRPNSAIVGVIGGGFTYEVSGGRGFRVDLRLQVRPNTVDTEISATPSVRTGTPGATAAFASNTSPTVVISNTGSGGTLTAPPITAFKTREGSGWRIDTALTFGYFWRF